MGRAIDMEKKQDALEARLKLVEDALEELIQNNSMVHHVDLVEDVRPVPEEKPKKRKVKKETASA